MSSGSEVGSTTSAGKAIQSVTEIYSKPHSIPANAPNIAVASKVKVNGRMLNLVKKGWSVHVYASTKMISSSVTEVGYVSHVTSNT